MNDEQYCKRRSRGKVVGAYYVMMSRPSEFLFRCHSEVRVMGISKESVRAVFSKHEYEASAILSNTIDSYKLFREQMVSLSKSID